MENILEIKKCLCGMEGHGTEKIHFTDASGMSEYSKRDLRDFITKIRRNAKKEENHLKRLLKSTT